MLESKFYSVDELYVENLRNVFINGFEYEDPNRKGVKRLQIPLTIFLLSGDDFPVVSLRKTYFKGAVAELILFLQGETDIRKYREAGIRFWDKDHANFEQRLRKQHKVEGFEPGGEVGDRIYNSLGEIYPYHYAKNYDVFDNFKANPYRTDLIVNSWQKDSLNPLLSALPPCHYGFQFIKTKDGFMLEWIQRSTDVLLGNSQNIIFYHLMGKILEIWTGYKFETLCGSLSNFHLYDNQIELAKEMINYYDKHKLKGEFKHKENKVIIDSSNWDIDKPFKEFIKSVKPSDFKIENYEPHIEKTVPMLAYDW